MMARLAYVNLLAQDIEALSRFYAETFGFREIEAHRSPIYRCLEAGGVELGFNAPLASELLNIRPCRLERDEGTGLFATFEMESEAALEETLLRARALGARVLKAPYDTYYNARQCVLEDPEGNAFRLNFRKGPRKPAAEVTDAPWAGRS